MKKIDGLKAQTADLDQDELTAARLALRPQMENEGRERIGKGSSDERISFAKYQASVRYADRALEDDSMVKRHQKQKRSKEWEKGFHQQKSR